jgi:hypothetical protein
MDFPCLPHHRTSRHAALAVGVFFTAIKEMHLFHSLGVILLDAAQAMGAC